MPLPPTSRRIAVVVLLGAACPFTAAQDPPPEPGQRVIVTGSQIPRIDAETALPLQVITREEILRSGVDDIDALMALISANFGGTTVAAGVGDSIHAGFSGASLRGMGDRYTLVLLDGRRVANHAFSDEGGVGVDLNAIPLAAIERVEVLRDGASAIYGSDAIAGVVNFILRSDFAGADAGVSRAWAQAGGGGATRGETLTAGRGALARDGYNLLAVVDHHQEQALPARKRWFAAHGYRPDIGLFGLSNSAFPANVGVPGSGLVNPAAPTCSPVTINLDRACFFDPDSQVAILPRTDKLGLLARATVAIPGGNRLRVELLWDRARQRFHIAASPINSGGLAGMPAIVIPVTSPYYPQGLGLTGDTLNLRYRTLQLGPRVDDDQTVAQRLFAGWQGRLGAWSVDAAVLQSLTRTTHDSISGNVDSGAIVAALATGEVNPFGDSGPVGDALVAAAQADGRAREATGRMRSVDVHASRDLAQWHGAPVTLGLGAELRNERLDDRLTALGSDAAGVGSRPLAKTGVRDMQAAYGELEVPALPGVDVQLALRVENYSDFGVGYNPKAAVRWRAASWMLWRGSAGTGMRAPTLPELYSPQMVSDFPLDLSDPIRCPVTQLDTDCDVEVPVTSGGNPALRPERSVQASLGLVLEPMAGATLSIDWWRLKLRNAITEPSSDVVLDGDPRFEGTSIQRGAVDPAFPTLPGPIVRLNQINQNLGGQTTSGIDIDLAWRSAATPLGRFSLGLAGSWLADWSATLPGVAPVRYAGQIGVARWRHTLTLGWDHGLWKATLVQTFVGSTADANGPPFLADHRVAPYDTWNAQLAWAPSAALDVAFGVRNLADKAPPATNSRNFGMDPALADPRGRVWYVRVEAHAH